MLHRWAYNRLKKKKKYSQKIYDVLLKFGDPIIETDIDGIPCKVRYSHMGIVYMSWYKLYDTQLRFIASSLTELYERNINIIDIGANVGDTILKIGNKKNKYLAVEGVLDYKNLLTENTKGYNIIVVDSFCGECNKNECGSVKIEKGTAKLISGDEEVANIVTLDDIVQTREFIPDFIKIDTDGYDFSVIRSGLNVLKNNGPVLYFEWTYPELVENGEDPVSIFGVLDLVGYKEGIIFDNFGVPFMRFRTSEVAHLGDLILYSYNRKSYFDILVVHESGKASVDYIWGKLARD